MNKLDKDYQNLLLDIIENGIEKRDRTRTGTLSVFGRQIRHKMSDGFPLLTTKKMYWKGIVTELLWFLRGDTNIKYLLDNDCHIWDGDAYKRYVNHWGDPIDPVNFELYTRLDLHPDKRLFTKEEFINKIKTDDEFAKTWGELGSIYGHQWRNWCEIHTTEPKKTLIPGLDQISKLIKDINENPDSRRLMVTAWNPADLDRMVLPPCHYGFQVYTRELSRKERVDLYIKKYGDTGMDYEKYKDTIPTRAISLMYNTRSQDVPLGTPFNIASYGLLLEIIAKEVNMVPDELISNMGDCHIYLNQIDGIKEQLSRDPYPLPRLKILQDSPSILEKTKYWRPEDFVIENYKSHPKINFPLSN